MAVHCLAWCRESGRGCLRWASVDAQELRAELMEMWLRQQVEQRQVACRVAADEFLKALPAGNERQSAVPVLGKDAEWLQDLLALVQPRAGE